MRCKRHTVDLSSSIGVCASCLRERLFSLAASNAVSQNDGIVTQPQSRISPPPIHHHHPLVFPRSVSPYVAPRKSDAGKGESTSRFFKTPQLNGVGSSEKVFESERSFKKEKKSGLSRFSNFFIRTRSDDFESRLRSKFSNRDSCDTFSPTTSSSSSSRSWFSKILKSKKQSSCYIEDLIASENDRPRQRFHRGMSPAGESTMTTDSFEESPGRAAAKRTPTTTMGTPGRRKTPTMSGMAFCLSPLVRAKPNNCSSTKWKGKFPPDFGYSGELKSPAKPHISTASSFCANRSKKLVDLGRVDLRR